MDTAAAELRGLFELFQDDDDHRIKSRRGHAKATVATGQKILTAAYHVLKQGVPYNELGKGYFYRRDTENTERYRRRLIRQLERLGHNVTLEPLPEAARAPALFSIQFRGVTGGSARPDCRGHSARHASQGGCLTLMDMISFSSRRGTPTSVRPGDLLRRLADAGADGSFSNSRRSQRFAAFERLVDGLPRRNGRPVRILDIGGTNSFWEQRGWAGRPDIQIVLVNIDAEPVQHANIEPRVGDAINLSEFRDDSFDIVFSNSVIEHLETFERQAAMAAEVQRLAPVFWVQTPNFWFPIEPHFLTPAWHWLPVPARVALLRRRRWGWRGPCPDPAEARELVREVRLMRRGELRRLFPAAALRAERIGPLVKSFVAVGS